MIKHNDQLDQMTQMVEQPAPIDELSPVLVPIQS